MQKVLGDFIQALRHAGLPISPAETLDALNAARLIGIHNPDLLRAGLGMTLAKSRQHQARFESVFEQFFSLGVDQPNAEFDTTSLPSANDSDPIVNSDVASSPLAQQLLAGDQAGLQMAIAAAAEQAGANQMQIFTQKPIVTMRIMKQLGEPQLNAELGELAADNKNVELVEFLQSQKQILREQIKNIVEQQFLLFSKEKGRQLREYDLQKIKLSNIDQAAYQQMSLLVKKAAKQLASMHSRRRKVTKRGLLDVRKTIAANAAYDGFLFHTKWKSTRIERPKVMVLCDVSGSVSRVARFLLLFLYSLQDVLPRVRSFVFSSDLGEVTDSFSARDVETAIGKIMANWANMPTDYGKALQDFNDKALKDIDNKTTVIMLGDARNNNGEGNAGIWQEVYRRSQRVLWLNPESRTRWNSGDSIMSEYSPYCSRVEHCSSLRDLTRILGSLLKHS